MPVTQLSFFNVFFQSTLLLSVIGLMACGNGNEKLNASSSFQEMNQSQNNTQDTTAIATFGTGCFWCTEAQFQQLKGVQAVESGYSGGHTKNPTYKEVCSGATGHAEVIQIRYNPTVISFEQLLAAFFSAHDPTTLNRQGADVGTQYRSVIFYHNEEQKKLAEYYKQKLNEEKVFDQPIVTEIAPYDTFYKAENYHQNYYNQNGNEPYCTMVIQPKLEKFRKVFKNQLKN